MARILRILLVALALTATCALRVGAQLSRRQVVTSIGATVGASISLPAFAFDLPSLEEFDDPRARKAAAKKPNPPANKQQSAAFYAVSTGDMTSLQSMVDNGWDIAKVTDTAGKTVLHRAAQVGNTAAVTLLLKNGAQVDPTTQWKETPLHMAARTGRLDSVKALVDAGAQTSKLTLSGDDALTLAKKYKMAPVVEYLSGK